MDLSPPRMAHTASESERAGRTQQHLPSAGRVRFSGHTPLLRPVRWLPWLPLLALGGCKLAILDPAGPVGLADSTLMIDSVAIMLCIIVPTMIGTIVVAWWYRAGNTRAQYRPDFVHSGTVELVIWGIPLLVIMLLGGVAWVGSHDLDPAKPLPPVTRPLRVQVVSLDWKWLFIYPDLHIASVNQLTIPAGTPVEFSLTSGSVMNAFFIPRLGSMIYTMNGMTTRLNLQADNPGTFLGESSHYSGDGFSDMHFDVNALAPDTFENWVDATRKKGPVLDEASYEELGKQSLNVQPFTYRDADPGLFARIVAQVIPPTGGPPPETPQRDVSPRSH